MEELIRIANLLRIPIDKVITFSTYVEIISANQNVGSLPFITVSNINTYDTSNTVLSKFRWDYIYSQNQQLINSLIYEFLQKNEDEEDEIEITIGPYRNIYIKDINGDLICGLICSYLDGEWTIEKS